MLLGYVCSSVQYTTPFKNQINKNNPQQNQVEGNVYSYCMIVVAFRLGSLWYMNSKYSYNWVNMKQLTLWILLIESIACVVRIGWAFCLCILFLVFILVMSLLISDQITLYYLSSPVIFHTRSSLKVTLHSH